MAANVGLGGQFPEAGVSVLTFNKEGKVSGVNVQNLPGPSFTERMLIRSRFEGTYIVNEDGTGNFDDSISETRFDFVITKTVQKHELKAATELAFIVRELSEPTGNLITAVATKLPNKGEFLLESLRSTFAFTGLGQVNKVLLLDLVI